MWRQNCCWNMRRFSSVKPGTYGPKRVSEHLEFWAAEQRPQPAATEDTSDSSRSHPLTRPLVLLFTWLGSTKKSVSNYCSLYHKRGMNVLTIDSRASEFLRHRQAIPIIDELVHYLDSNTNDQTDLIVHAISIGAFIYSVGLLEAKTSSKIMTLFQDRIKGEIFDSIVYGSTGRMAEGVALSAMKNSLARTTVKSTLNAYFYFTRNSVVSYFDKAIDAFRETPLDIPRIFLYSKDDPLCDADKLKVLIDTWLEDGKDVTVQSWDKSRHAAHLREHTDDYIRAHTSFLNRNNFGQIKANL